MTELSGAFDFRKSTTRFLAGTGSLTTDSDIFVPTFAGTWTVVNQIDVVNLDTGTGSPAFWVGIAGPAATVPFFGGISSHGPGEWFSWRGEMALNDNQNLHFRDLLTTLWSIAVSGFFQPSESQS